jgi:hypothetical protein
MGTNSIARICPGLPATSLFETKTSRDADLPIRKSAGDEALAIWGRDERGEDEESSWLKPEGVARLEFLERTEAEKSASDYTRSSSTTREISDHTSLSSALWLRVRSSVL